MSGSNLFRVGFGKERQDRAAEVKVGREALVIKKKSTCTHNTEHLILK